METSLVDWEYWLNTWPDHPIASTRANAADGYPKPLTPLSQDLVLTYEEAAVRRFYFEGLGVLGPADAPDPYMAAHYGLVYLNADQMAGLGEATPGSSGQAMYQQFFGLEPDPAYRLPRRGVKARLGEAVTGVRVLPRMLRLAKRLPEDIDRQVARVTGARPQGPLDTVPDAELGAWLARLDALQIDAWYPLPVGAATAGAFYEVVRKQLQSWAGDESGDLANRLHVGLGKNESAEAGQAIRRLADAIREEGVASALDDPDALASIRDRSPAIGARLDATIERFGHRGPAELELSNPSWRADPTQLLEVLRIELQRGAHSPEETGRIRVEAEEELRRRLGSLKRAAVLPALRRSQALMSLRENGKIPVVKLWDELRRLVAAVQPRLMDRGVLADPSHVFQLRHSELREVLAGGTGPGPEHLAERHAQYQRCLTLDLPELVEVGNGWLRPLDEAFIRSRGLLPPAKLEADVACLRGIAAAPGVTTATARVLLEPDDDFAPGDVLVARTVDPGWAPVLACAGAVVLDIGGLLSHGAVVARELGIPCVVNVKAGTELVRPGSVIRVDGSAGEVVLDAG